EDALYRAPGSRSRVKVQPSAPNHFSFGHVASNSRSLQFCDFLHCAAVGRLRKSGGIQYSESDHANEGQSHPMFKKHLINNFKSSIRAEHYHSSMRNTKIGTA